MGCGASAAYGIPSDQAKPRAESLRTRYGRDVMILGIKDQNTPGKICLSGGDLNPAMLEAITAVLQTEMSKDVKLEMDQYDSMWDVAWRNTTMTMGSATFSLAKSYFPKGKPLVKLLDTIAQFGWGLSATPNFGGAGSSGDDDGSSCVDWPIFIFYKEQQSKFTDRHLFFAVKDSNIPGKLCAAGPLGDLEADMQMALACLKPDVQSEKDSYDSDFDVVWRNTSITSGSAAMSMAKAYFPKGKTNLAILDCVYTHGWRAVAAPNFGGAGYSWPCIVFRKLKESGEPPETLFGSIKDSNVPGKLCLSGASADHVADAICGALTKLPGNDKARSEMDSYDEDYDAVCREVNLTTGHAAFSRKLPYFPRCDSMVAVLNTLAEEGFQVVACPTFGNMLDSWPSFILEKRDYVPVQIFLAVKDENTHGKVCLGGGGIASNPQLATDLLDVLSSLCGENVEQTVDEYDKSFDLVFKNTVVSSGFRTFTLAKPFWPHGHVVEMLLQVLFKHGWVAEGGPSFGNGGTRWPGIILSKASDA